MDPIDHRNSDNFYGESEPFMVKNKRRTVMQQKNRSLTYDEKKAAEAAFKGLPFDSNWSEAAHKVYLGISSTMADKGNEVFQEDGPLETTTTAMQSVSEFMQMSRS